MAASDQSAPAVSPPSAQVVGNAFVHQYYHILHHSPQLVYRFYQERSKLGRPEPQGLMNSVTGMDAINEKIISMDYSDYTAAIKNVDAQESHDGGVIVLVTGCLTGKERTRNFTQSFFLAPQDKGYYVLNDIFRYVDVEDHQPGIHALTSEAGAVTPDQEVPAEQDPGAVELSVSPETEEEVVNEEEVYNPSEGEDGWVVEEAPTEEVINEVANIPQPVSAETSTATLREEAPKKSYASIVKVMKENAASVSAPATVPPPARPVPVNPEHQAVLTPIPAPTPEIASGSVSIDSTISQDAEADGRSIYIRSLPLNATLAQLEEAFKKFGPIKPDGIQVRSNKQQGFCFGFVEFEVASAVQSAIESSPIMIGGRQAFVEEKRPSGSRVSSSRGRYIPGRGGGFRNEGVRGRGNYGGGRGFGRGDYGNRTDFSGRVGGRGPSNRGTEAGYQRVDHPGSNGARGNHAIPATNNASSKNDMQPSPA